MVLQKVSSTCLQKPSVTFLRSFPKPLKPTVQRFSPCSHIQMFYTRMQQSATSTEHARLLFFCIDKKQVLYQHLEHKGHDGLSRTPLKNFESVVVHDHDRSYYSYGSSHQECIAHVLRYLVCIFYPILMSIILTTSVSGDFENLNENRNRLLCSGTLTVDSVFVMHLQSSKLPGCNSKMSMILLKRHSQNNYQSGTRKFVKYSH